MTIAVPRLLTVNAAGVEPKWTEMTLRRPVPRMTVRVPPAPVSGVTRVTSGAVLSTRKEAVPAAGA